MSNIAMDKVTRKKATIPSAMTGPSWPLAAIPSIFPALKTAAMSIPNQFAKVPYNANQKVTFSHLSDNSTLCQINPKTIRKMPFKTPSMWLDTPSLGFASTGAIRPMIKPKKNSKTPRNTNLSAWCLFKIEFSIVLGFRVVAVSSSSFISHVAQGLAMFSCHEHRYRESFL
jgi:hypothetical protein